jgi:hypothetical protein
MSAPLCPMCGAPATAANQPFCSQRCADLDLHRWLSGRYAIPAAEGDEADDEPSDES